MKNLFVSICIPTYNAENIILPTLKNIIKQNFEIYRAGKKNNVYISPLALAFKKSSNRITQFISKPTKEI